MSVRLSLVIAGIAAALSVYPETATAQEDELLYSEQWTGAHLGAGLLVGPAFLGNDVLVDSIGYAVGARLTGALIMQAFHLEVAYLHSACSASLEGDPLDFRSNRMSVGVGLHPLFLTALFANRLWYTVAGVYFLFGLNVDFNRLEWRSDDLDESWRIGLSLGAGLDVPLDSPDDGAGFWLGLVYRYDSARSHFAPLRLDGSIDQHAFFLSLTFRNNGLPL